MLREHEIEGLVVGVTIRDTGNKPDMTRLETAVMLLGGPQVVTRFCNAFNLTCCGLVIVYLVVWTFWLQGVVLNTLHPTMGQALFLSLSWLPLMVVQLATNALRYGCLTMQIKGAQEMVNLSNEKTFNAISACIHQTLHAYVNDANPEAKPTLQ